VCTPLLLVFVCLFLKKYERQIRRIYQRKVPKNVKKIPMLMEHSKHRGHERRYAYRYTPRLIPWFRPVLCAVYVLALTAFFASVLVLSGCEI
jgi:hypothetical protein